MLAVQRLQALLPEAHFAMKSNDIRQSCVTVNCRINIFIPGHKKVENYMSL